MAKIKVNSVIKRIGCIILMAVMLVSLAACQNDAEESVKETEEVPQVEGVTVNNGNYLSAIDNAQVGDLFVLGANEKNCEEPIQWRVIDKNEKGIFLLSEKILYNSDFKYDEYNAAWDTSPINSGLNSEMFFGKHFCFSEADIKHIRRSSLVASDNPQYGTSGGEDTVSRLFLLSFDEVMKYFPDEESRCAMFGSNSFGNWWIRTPGKDTEKAMFVNDTGVINMEGEELYEDNIGVRPAMWLVKEEQYDVFGAKTQQYPDIKDANAGNMVLFGNYGVNGTTSEKPIEWYVLAKDNNKLLLISRYIIEKKEFGNSYYWEDCSLREWLNSDFYNSSFSEEEKSKIQRMITSDKTDDKVFLLSAEEARTFFCTDATRVANVSHTLIVNGLFDDYNGTGNWWTRSISTALNGKGVVPVEADGNVRSAGTGPYTTEGYTDIGVRPVICVDISSAEDKALNMSIFGCDSNHSLDNEPMPSRKGDNNCPVCKGTGSVKYYYGSSDLEAILDGYDPYSFGKCPSCG